MTESSEATTYIDDDKEPHHPSDEPSETQHEVSTEKEPDHSSDEPSETQHEVTTEKEPNYSSDEPSETQHVVNTEKESDHSNEEPSETQHEVTTEKEPGDSSDEPSKTQHEVTAESVNGVITEIPSPLVTNEEITKDTRVKIITLGDSSVGKTCFILRYCFSTFPQDERATLGVDVISKDIEKDGKIIPLIIWDTAGSERYRAVSTSYLRDAHGCILMYDITERKTFKSVSKWVEEIKEKAPKDLVVILVGNKNDKAREVPYKDGKMLADKHPFIIDFFETSAKSPCNVDETFMKLLNGIPLTPASIKNIEDRRRKAKKEARRRLKEEIARSSCC